jgi:hypothetical protein
MLRYLLIVGLLSVSLVAQSQQTTIHDLRVAARAWYGLGDPAAQRKADRLFRQLGKHAGLRTSTALRQAKDPVDRVALLYTLARLGVQPRKNGQAMVEWYKRIEASNSGMPNEVEVAESLLAGRLADLFERTKDSTFLRLLFSYSADGTLAEAYSAVVAREFVLHPIETARAAGSRPGGLTRLEDFVVMEAGVPENRKGILAGCAKLARISDLVPIGDRIKAAIVRR